MRFGCCLNMASTKADGTGAEWLSALKKAGYDYAELPMAQMMQLDDGQFRKLSGKLEKVGIPCETSNNLFPVTMRLTGPVVDMDEVLTYAGKAFERAEQLGVARCVFGSGPAKSVPEGFPKEEGLHQIEELLHRIAPVAVRHHVTIVLEPLRKQEDNLINTFEEGVLLAKKVQEENVKVLVDFYHFTVEEEPLEHLLRDGREYLRHVHFANPNGWVYPQKAEEADYLPFVSALKEVGYNERISCEAYPINGFEEDAPLSRTFFEELFAGFQRFEQHRNQ